MKSENLKNVNWDSLFIEVAKTVTASLLKRPGKSSNFLRRTFEEEYKNIYNSAFPFNWKLFEKLVTDVFVATEKGKSLSATKSFISVANPENNQKEIEQLLHRLQELQGRNLMAV